MVTKRDTTVGLLCPNPYINDKNLNKAKIQSFKNVSSVDGVIPPNSWGMVIDSYTVHLNEPSYNVEHRLDVYVVLKCNTQIKDEFFEVLNRAAYMEFYPCIKSNDTIFESYLLENFPAQTEQSVTDVLYQDFNICGLNFTACRNEYAKIHSSDTEKIKQAVKILLDCQQTQFGKKKFLTQKTHIKKTFQCVTTPAVLDQGHPSFNAPMVSRCAFQFSIWVKGEFTYVPIVIDRHDCTDAWIQNLKLENPGQHTRDLDSEIEEMVNWNSYNHNTLETPPKSNGLNLDSFDTPSLLPSLQHNSWENKNSDFEKHLMTTLNCMNENQDNDVDVEDPLSPMASKRLKIDEDDDEVQGLKFRLMKMENALLKEQNKVLQIQAENQQLRSENSALKNKLNVIRNMCEYT